MTTDVNVRTFRPIVETDAQRILKLITDAANRLSILFQPDATPGPGVATTWAEVMAAIAASPVPLLIVVDCTTSGPFAVPVGVHDLKGATLGATSIGNPAANVLRLVEGAVLEHLAGLTDAVTLQGEQTATPSIVYAPTPTSPAFLVIERGAALANQGSAPMITLPSTGASPAMILALLENGQIGTTAAPTIALASGANLLLIGFDQTTITGDWLSGDGACTLALGGNGAFATLPPVGASFLGTPLVAANGPAWGGSTALRPALNPGESIGFVYFDTTLGKLVVWDGAAWQAVGGAGFPVTDAVFEVVGAVDATKALRTDLSGQTASTTTTIATTGTVARTFTLPDITGTALVQQVGTGFVFIGQPGQLYGSNAGMQFSTLVANRAQFRGNQYGAHAAGAGVTGFKSRATFIGAPVQPPPGTPGGGCLGGDILLGFTAIGVTPDDMQIPLAGTLRFQVPAGFVAAGQNYLPAELSLSLADLTGPTNSIRQVVLFSSGGETQTLRGVRAGGAATVPGSLGTGSLWSSGAGDPNGTVTGKPGDLYTNTLGGAGTTLYVKESGVGTNTGWTGK